MAKKICQSGKTFFRGCRGRWVKAGFLKVPMFISFLSGKGGGEPYADLYENMHINVLL